ncbi:MAG TPA: UDP-N-acetylmuramate dehydrogenase [Spirochaetota bacterium]
MTTTTILNIVSDVKEFATVRTGADMRQLTTFKTGGVADILAYPRSIDGASALVRYARDRSIPLTVIGGGSNLIVGDKGIRGIVVRMAEDDIGQGIITKRGEGIVYADAITRKRDLIEFAVANGFDGSQFMAGIPGCVGGGIHMNAGTFMGNYIDILDRVIYVDSNGEERDVSTTKDMAHYRGIDLADALIIYGAVFSFKGTQAPDILRKAVEDIVDDRKKKHPQDPSAGSVFKNPEGHFSWKLVNDAGLKGKRIGGAMVSDLHTNFIINAGGATSRNIRDLIECVRSEVQKQFGIDLHTEVRFVGEF